MESNTQNRPSHKIYQVLDLGEDKKSHWNQIGVAWAHKDGNGLNLQLNMLPLKGSIVIRTIQEEGA